MKPRRRQGATLGLVAVSVLVIIVIGVGCYFLIKLCGGGREVANSTDAGTLNVAKAALRTYRASAKVPPGMYQNFLACLDPAISSTGDERISLLSYNRCVAQALLIAINAQDSGSADGIAFANQVWTDLQQIGGDLRTAISSDNSWRNAAFNGLATNNNMKMFGNNTLQMASYDVAYMKPGNSANVWFSDWTFGQVTDPATGNSFTYPQYSNGQPPAGLYYTGSDPMVYKPDTGTSTIWPGVIGAEKTAYMAGYQPIGPVLGHVFMAVPVFPQQKPHLVQLKDFNAAKAQIDPNGNTPPNAVSIQTRSSDSKSGGFGGAVSAAIVGATFSAGGGGALAALGAAGPVGGIANFGSNDHFDFVAELPSGYVQIQNDPPYGGGAGGFTGPGDGQNNIFNWELNPVGGGPGVNLQNSSANGGENVFFQDAGTAGSTVQSWADYNAAADKNDWNDTANNNQHASGQPQGSLQGIYVATNGGQSSRAATAQDMAGLGQKNPNDNCLKDLIDNNMGYPPSAGPPSKCANNLNAMSNAFGRGMNGGGNADPQIAQYWSNVDQIKKQIAQAFNTPYVGVQAPGGKSGLGAYKVPKSGSQAPAIPWNGGNGPPLEKVSTIMDIVNQVGGCASTKVVTGIWQRCNQITPGVSYNDVVGLLSSTNIGMGQTLYIQRNKPEDPKSQLVIRSTAPQNSQVQQILAFPAIANKLPDGNRGTDAATCDSGAYDLYNGGYGLVDTKVGNGIGDGKGDNDLHDQPYTAVNSNLEATDHANWVDSSGFGGMLGRLEFYQTTSGAGAFSRPN